MNHNFWFIQIAINPKHLMLQRISELPNADCDHLSDQASTSTSTFGESYTQTNGDVSPYNLIIILLCSGTAVSSFTMDEPSRPLAGNTTTVRVQSTLSSETVTKIWPITKI